MVDQRSLSSSESEGLWEEGSNTQLTASEESTYDKTIFADLVEVLFHLDPANGPSWLSLKDPDWSRILQSAQETYQRKLHGKLDIWSQTRPLRCTREEASFILKTLISLQPGLADSFRPLLDQLENDTHDQTTLGLAELTKAPELTYFAIEAATETLDGLDEEGYINRRKLFVSMSDEVTFNTVGKAAIQHLKSQLHREMYGTQLSRKTPSREASLRGELHLAVHYRDSLKDNYGELFL